jgi:flagellar biosynthesis/type III secretory pathway protein FliH
MPGPEAIFKLRSIRTRGFDPDNENFLEALGFNPEDAAFVIKLVEALEEEASTVAEAFQKVLEYSRYAEDEVVKAFMMFHLGATFGKKATVKQLEDIDKTKFTEGYKEGFADGFKEGINAAKDLMRDLDRKVKMHYFRDGLTLGINILEKVIESVGDKELNKRLMKEAERLLEEELKKLKNEN